MALPRQSGATLIELLVTLLIALVIVLAALAVHGQGNTLRADIQATVEIQDNVRLGLDRIGRDLRMIGFGVPDGQRIGATTLWTPVVFYANSTSLGFRAEIDGGYADVTCTPNSSNVKCPQNRLRLDDVGYYQRLACKPPDGASGSLKLVAVVGGGAWEPTTCTAADASTKTLSLTANVSNATFIGGDSEAVTIEQVYLRYVASTAPPYGKLLRYVRYDNTPNDTFPPTGVTWETVATHLTSFSISYRDSAGNALTGSPLTAANRALIARVVVTVSGYDTIGPEDRPREYFGRSEVLVRNAS